LIDENQILSYNKPGHFKSIIKLSNMDTVKVKLLDDAHIPASKRIHILENFSFFNLTRPHLLKLHHSKDRNLFTHLQVAYRLQVLH